MKKKLPRRKYRPKNKTFKGGIGSLYVVAVLVLMSVLGYMMIGQSLPSTSQANPNNAEVAIQTPIPTPGQSNLQLYTFNGATLTPAPTSEPQAPPAACTYVPANTEQNMIFATDPHVDVSVSGTGEIRVWVTDEGAPYISPGEIVSSVTGVVTTRGNVKALDVGTNGNGQYSWEPTIYIYPAGTTQFNCNSVNNSCPEFYPYKILGTYNNEPTTCQGNFCGGNAVTGAPYDTDYTQFENNFTSPQSIFTGPGLQNFTDEYVWDVQQFALQPGNYDAQYVVHDGDVNLGVSCVNISVTATTSPSPT